MTEDNVLYNDYIFDIVKRKRTRSKKTDIKDDIPKAKTEK